MAAGRKDVLYLKLIQYLLHDQIEVSTFECSRGVTMAVTLTYFVSLSPRYCNIFQKLRLGHGGDMKNSLSMAIIYVQVFIASILYFSNLLLTMAPSSNPKSASSVLLPIMIDPSSHLPRKSRYLSKPIGTLHLLHLQISFLLNKQTSSSG